MRVETRTTADDGIQVGTVMTATGTPVEDEVAPPPPPPTPTPPAVDERGLPRVSIEDASAMEGDDLEFRVVLSKAVQHRVKVYWATRPGTARGESGLQVSGWCGGVQAGRDGAQDSCGDAG